jgi:hypothetical protein
VFLGRLVYYIGEDCRVFSASAKRVRFRLPVYKTFVEVARVLS